VGDIDVFVDDIGSLFDTDDDTVSLLVDPAVGALVVVEDGGAIRLLSIIPSDVSVVEINTVGLVVDPDVGVLVGVKDFDWAIKLLSITTSDVPVVDIDTVGLVVDPDVGEFVVVVA
jgi:hypothetical protein